MRTDDDAGSGHESPMCPIATTTTPSMSRRASSRPALRLITTSTELSDESASTPQLARAYCGKAHGISWTVIQDQAPEKVAVATSHGTAAHSVSAYQLVRQPRSGRPAKDSQGNYLYLWVQDAAAGTVPDVCDPCESSTPQRVENVCSITSMPVGPTPRFWDPACR